jgi:hypothetical protein
LDDDYGGDGQALNVEVLIIHNTLVFDARSRRSQADAAPPITATQGKAVSLSIRTLGVKTGC